MNRIVKKRRTEEAIINSGSPSERNDRGKIIKMQYDMTHIFIRYTGCH